jgi:hypothetical protein
MAKAVAAVGTKAQLNFAVQVTLAPAAGGQELKPAALKRYRTGVKAAILRIKLTDDASAQQWKNTQKPVRAKTVETFLSQLRSNYPGAVRSVTIVGADESVLAVGDAAAGARRGTVRVLG